MVAGKPIEDKIYGHKQEKQRKNYERVRGRNYKFVEVENFQYLGTMINNRNGRIRQRIKEGYAAYYRYKMFTKSKGITKNIKMYQQNHKSKVTYASEAIYK